MRGGTRNVEVCTGDHELVAIHARPQRPGARLTKLDHLLPHHVVDGGLIAHAEFIIPTVRNVMAIERALRVAAERYIRPEPADLELEDAKGRAVRAFDPCIACAPYWERFWSWPN